MTILFSLLNYGSLTGSELYVYELARELSKKHTVYIQSTLKEGVLLEKTHALGIETLGWKDRPSVDIVHASQTVPTRYSLLEYSCPVVQTLHSELLPEHESPVLGCKAYIAIRPEIKQWAATENIDATLIYNPFDVSRFKPSLVSHEIPVVLFVGSVDYLRKGAINDLIAKHVQKKLALVGVGRGWVELAQSLSEKGITIQAFEDMWHVEELLAQCDYTAGILLGRSTIEGFLCGKPGFIYEVDTTGKVLGIRVENPPKDLTQFDSRHVAQKVEEVYASCL